VKLIFLAASILAQLRQRPFPESNPVDKRGPPHFLHLAATVMSTYFMMTSGAASYKEKTKRLGFARQLPQNELILNVRLSALKNHEELPVLLERLFRERRLQQPRASSA